MYSVYMPETHPLAAIAVQRTLTDRRITADYIADALRRAINEGQLADGAELNQVELATHFGVSRVPVREALRQLQAEGLIESHAHRLSFVRATDPARLAEVFSLRALIEGWLMERAVPHVQPETIAAAREVNERLRQETDHAAWLELNQEFHQLLFNAASSEEALALLEPLRLRSQRYSRLWSKGGAVHRPVDACSEHDRILELVEAGDAAGARTASEQHVMHSCDAVVAAGRMIQEGQGN